MTRHGTGSARLHSAGPRKDDLKDDLAGASITFQNTKPPRRPQAQIVRLPIFRDGVFVGNEFIPISPRLRARIREMAAEGSQ
jgi:hypothetical protein